MLSSTLYTKFPTIYYNDELSTNITVRLKFKDVVKKNLAVYYPYTIIEGERPDTLAFKYYDDASYSWLIFLANDIYDPMFDWPLSNDLFDGMLISKYGSIAAAQEKTMFYRVEWASDDSVINPSTYHSLPSTNKKYWAPIVSDVNGNVTGYQRAQVDWAVETNKIINLVVEQSADEALAVDDIVYQLTGGQISAKAVVDSFNLVGMPIVKHVEGAFVADKSLYVQRDQDILYGNVTRVNQLAANLTPNEENYWVPVSAYDYEMEINEGKKHIVLIDKIYLDVIEKDLRNLLA